MLDRGDAVVYKCRGLYKVEEIGTLDFCIRTAEGYIIHCSLWRIPGTGCMCLQMMRDTSAGR